MRVVGVGQGQQGGAQGTAFHLERRTAGGLEAIAEIAGIGFQRDTRRIEACGLGRFTGHRAEQHRRCTQPRTGDQRRQLRRTCTGIGIDRHSVAAIVQAQVVQARLVGAGFSGDRQPGQNSLAALGLAIVLAGGNEAVLVAQAIGQHLQRIDLADAALHLAHAHRVHLQGLQLGGQGRHRLGGRGLFQGQHSERGRVGPGRGGQCGRQGQGQCKRLCKRFHRQA